MSLEYQPEKHAHNLTVRKFKKIIEPVKFFPLIVLYIIVSYHLGANLIVHWRLTVALSLESVRSSVLIITKFVFFHR